MRSRWYENVILLLVAFTLFRPGFWMDIVHDPYRDIPPAQLAQASGRGGGGQPAALAHHRARDAVGDAREFRLLLLPVPEGDSGDERLQKLGLLTYEDGDKVLVDSVTFGSPAAEAGLEFDQQILKVRAPTERLTKELMWIPGFLLFGSGGVAAASATRPRGMNRHRGAAQHIAQRPVGKPVGKLLVASACGRVSAPAICCAGLRNKLLTICVTLPHSRFSGCYSKARIGY